MRKSLQRWMLFAGTLATVVAVWYVDQARAGFYNEATRDSVAESVMFHDQLDDKIRDMEETNPETRARLLAEPTEEVQEALIIFSEGGSACVASGCVASACAASGCVVSGCGGSACAGSACGGSACGGSGCAGSLCGGSGCAGSGCGASGCVGSGCGGSSCVGSGCGGSNCVGTGCAGSSCPKCSAASADHDGGAEGTRLASGHGRISGLNAERTAAGATVTWISTGVVAESYRLYLVPEGEGAPTRLLSQGKNRPDALMRVPVPAPEAGASYVLEIVDSVGTRLRASLDAPASAG